MFFLWRRHMRIKAIICIFLIMLILAVTSVQARRVAVFMNIPCLDGVTEEFNQWKNSTVIQEMFHEMIFMGKLPRVEATKLGIITTMRNIYELRPDTVYYFIYGYNDPNPGLISLDFLEIKQELFIVNGHFIAPEIIIMDINKSFQKYDYDHQLPKNEPCNVVKAELSSLEAFSRLRQKIITDQQPLSINRLREIYMVPITTMIQQNIFDTVSLRQVNHHQAQSNNFNAGNAIQSENIITQEEETDNKHSQELKDTERQKNISNNIPSESTLYDKKIEPVTSALEINPVDRNSLVYYSKFEERIGNGKRQSFILQSVSDNNYLSTTNHKYPYDYLNILTKDFYSPYFYIFTKDQELEVYHKKKGNLLFRTPIPYMPMRNELNFNISTEYSSNRLTVFGFPMSDNKSKEKKFGLCVKQNNFSFINLNTQDYEIEAMTVSLKDNVNNSDGLVYIWNQCLRYHPLTSETQQSIIDDKTLISDSRLKGLLEATIIWRPPSALILAKNIGLLLKGRKTLKVLFRQNDIQDSHLDTFYSGDGKRFGFIWSGVSLGQQKFYVWLGLEQKDKSIRLFDITKKIENIVFRTVQMKNLIAPPYLFLKDQYTRFDQLHGALIHPINHDKCSVKYITISLMKGKIEISKKEENSFLFRVSANDIKVLNPKYDKLIVFMGKKIETNTKNLVPNIMQLFLFPKIKLSY